MTRKGLARPRHVDPNAGVPDPEFLTPSAIGNGGDACPSPRPLVSPRMVFDPDQAAPGRGLRRQTQAEERAFEPGDSTRAWDCAAGREHGVREAATPPRSPGGATHRIGNP